MKPLPLVLLVVMLLVSVDASQWKRSRRKLWRKGLRMQKRMMMKMMMARRNYRWLRSTTKLHGRDLDRKDIQQRGYMDQPLDEVLFNARDAKGLLTSAGDTSADEEVRTGQVP
ncbi:uncharacterized protein [Haliotis asinina]|uniref:uncharacterized protein n=1 Tax=Haliotis asinina TaxID=109174 RepID=UPI003532031C